jgi:hypothetical protein
MITSATVYLHPQSGQDWLRCKASIHRALPTSIIACQAVRGHCLRTLPAAFLCACLCTLLRFMRTFYSIQTVLSSNLSIIPCFSRFPPFPLTLPPPSYSQRYSPFRALSTIAAIRWRPLTLTLAGLWAPPTYRLLISLASCLSPARMARAAQLPTRRTLHDGHA